MRVFGDDLGMDLTLDTTGIAHVIIVSIAGIGIDASSCGADSGLRIFGDTEIMRFHNVFRGGSIFWQRWQA